MNLRQLRSLCEIIDHGLHISAAANALHRSQPSVTRQILDLETELNVQIFVRRKNRITDVTPQGKELVAIARRVLQDTTSMHLVGQDDGADAKGELKLATTHTQARYVLPRVIREFMSRFPNVKLGLRQGDPLQCCDLVYRGAVDMAICAEVADLPQDVVHILCYRMSRSVITPPRHPLLRVHPLTLEAISRYPIITYDDAFSGRRIVDKAFSDRALTPSIVLSAVDADVAKSYVEIKVGVAILATIVFDEKRDTGLRRIDARHLFASSNVGFALRRNSYFPRHALAFMQLFAPKLREMDIVNALAGRSTASNRAGLPQL